MSLNIHTMHLPPENLHPRRSYTSLHGQHTPLIHIGTRDHPQSVSYDPALGSGSPVVSPQGKLCTSNRCYPTGRSLFGACTSYRWECHALHIFQFHNASVPRSAVSPTSHDLFVFHPLWRILTPWYSCNHFKQYLPFLLIRALCRSNHCTWCVQDKRLHIVPCFALLHSPVIYPACLVPFVFLTDRHSSDV